MGYPLKILTIGVILFISESTGQSIVQTNDNVNVTDLGSDRYVVSMNENNHDFDDGSTPHTLLFSIINANSAPIMSFVGSPFTYEIQNNTDDNTTYLFYASQSFDYETQQRSYGFNLIIQNMYYLYVSFSINNIDDEPPSLTSPQCLFDENTIYTAANSTCSCIVSDPDGWLDQMTFEIIPNTGGEEDIFALEYRESPPDTAYNYSVYVTVRQQLNYQNVTFYLFDIKAQDGANHPTTPNELVRAIVNVNDLPDTPPEWTNYFTFQQFEEQEEQTFSVTAVDGDHGLNYVINYAKLWEDDEDADYISIDQENGTIHVKKIDRDKDDISMYNFEIMAYEVIDAPIWNNTLNISFYVIDIDNNSPLIKWITDASFENVTFDDVTNKSTNMSFLENFSGTLNLTIYVKDIDTGENAQFTVELEDIENEYNITYTDAFSIVPTAGYRSALLQISVKNVTYLDYEVPEWDNFAFNVLTKGLLDPNKQDRLLVNISLIDYNDELPIFSETEYTVSINETAKNGDFIIQIMATDRDAEDANLTHTLVGSTYTNRVLRIENNTGEIYVNADNAFDYDTVNPIFVQIRATDRVGHATTVPLTINLLDVNNKAPTINVGDPINVDENQNSTTRLNATITASDVDTTANLTAEISWDNSYAMKNSRRLDMTNDTILQQIRFIDVSYDKSDDDPEYTREIEIYLIVNDNNPDGTAPDFELFDSLYISLVVTDWNTDPEFVDNRMNTSALILISINDINDNTPYFPEALLPESERENRTVQENAPKGTSVGSIIAIDLDVDDTVTYNCTALDPNFDWVDINTETGAFTVKNNSLIDADTNKTFYFNYSCTASDDGYTHTSDPMIVSFYIIDTNNKMPVITIDDDVYVDEKSPPATVVTEIGTKDEDRDIPFHTVKCSFTQRNGSCFDSFSIDDNVITVKFGYDDIDRDEGIAQYDCSITCEDNPDRLQNDQTQHTVTRDFRINLRDINDWTPQVMTTEITVTENVNEGETIGVIVAMDKDEGDNAEIVFNISSVTQTDGSEGSDLFDIVTDDDYSVNLTHKQANLVALRDLRNQYGTYIISIGVSDKGDPPNSNFSDVTLVVEMFNFVAPRFIYPSSENQAFILLSSQQLDSPLIYFRSNESEHLDNFYASDSDESDVCEKWDIFFTFEQTSPDEDTIFTIAKNGTCSGQLQINNMFNSDSVLGKTYNLKLTANIKEGEPLEGEAPYTSDRNIIINFLDNNQKPVFSVREWEFEFLEEDSSLTQELEYKATYEIEDPEDNLKIYYYLVSDNETIAALFNVNNITGLISLNDKLDYETDEEFTFQIVASNDTSATSNNPNSYLDVTCTVIDINDNVPQWTRSYFFGAIMSGYIRNTPVLTLEATDADKIDEGKLTYNLNGTFLSSGTGLVNVPSEPFTITTSTGEVRLNFQVDSTMAGYFQFNVTVWDVVDAYGNGPHWNTTSVTIFIITSDNTVDFRFYNTIEEVQNKEHEMLDVISGILEYDAYKQNIDKETQDGVELDDQTFASLYFINSSIIEAVEADTILRLVSNINIFSQLVSTLRNETGLILMSFPSTSTTSENLEEVLRAWLVGVSVVLGALCLILLVTFILKTRELNNRITNLTTRKFGSQESGLNRLGISAPTTNLHATEGSNPIFNISNDGIKRDLRDFDEASMGSGDSDLIGVEDNPQFDYQPEKLNGTSNYF